MKIAEEYLIKSNQKNLLNEQNISKYNYLNLTIDEKGLIRYTGRLSLAPLPYETRSPILLDLFHPLTKLIMRGTNVFDIKIHLQSFDSAFGLYKEENQFEFITKMYYL